MKGITLKLGRTATLLLLVVSMVATACVATRAPGAPSSETGAATGGEAQAGISGNVEFWHFWGSPVRRNAVRRIMAICQEQLPNVQITETFKPFATDVRVMIWNKQAFRHQSS